MQPYTEDTTPRLRPENGLSTIRSLPVWTRIAPARRWPENPATTVARSAESRRLGYYLGKRCIDLAISSIALIILAPLFLVLAVLVKLHSEGPAIFKQDRVGFDPRTGQVRIFRLYKFRSMRVNSDPGLHREYVQSLIENNTDPDGESLKMVDDPRITGIGRILRNSSLDELPQLFNVLKGDMSLVGPRPALPYEVEAYREWHKRRLLALPGLTGWWQVNGRNCVSFDESVLLDIYYIEHQSLSLDLKILLLTPWAVISGRGAG